MTCTKTYKEVMQELINRTTSKHTHLIGIDPDVEKNGVCLYERKTKSLSLLNLTFFQLFDFLVTEKHKGTVFKVVIEAGWLNKSNWHLKNADSKRVAAAKGKNTGENHETGRKIVEMCEYLKLDHALIRPTRRKLNSEQFKAYTGYSKRTNTEQRDAAMLVYGM